MNFLIIGGDAAGMSAASRAKRHQPDLDVTVLEKTADVSYSACGMPYNIADADRELEDLVVRKAEVFRQKQGIDLFTGYRVVFLIIAVLMLIPLIMAIYLTISLITSAIMNVYNQRVRLVER